jgi:hypothetical protein
VCCCLEGDSCLTAVWCNGLVLVERWWCSLLPRRTGGPATDRVAELGLLTTDADQGKLCLSLGQPHGWPLGPEEQEPHDHSAYFCWRFVVRSLHASSGSSVSVAPIYIVLRSKSKLCWELLIYDFLKLRFVSTKTYSMKHLQDSSKMGSNLQK